MVQKVIKLSIIVPFFNVDRYAPENLASLAQNASPDIESGDCTCTHARLRWSACTESATGETSQRR